MLILKKEPLKVICVDPGRSKCLFKNQTYNCIQLIKYRDGSIRLSLENIPVKQDIKKFTLLDGSPVPEEEFNNNLHWYSQSLSNNYEGYEVIGAKVICTNPNLKTLIPNKLYHVSDAKLNRSGNIYKVKIKETGKFYSSWNFISIPTHTLRDLEISGLLEQDDEDLKELTTYKREEITEEEKILNIITSVQDAIKYRKNLPDGTNLTLMDIIEKRSLNKYGLEKSDFSRLSTLNWEELIYS